MDASEIRERLKENGEFTINDILDEEEEDWSALESEALLGTESEETSNTALSAESGTDKPVVEQSETAQDCIQPTGCGVIVVKDGKVLIGKKKDNGKICGPGGHIEAGETAEQAAIRETREEFGINVAGLVPITIIADMPPEYCPSQVFLCTEYYGEPVCFNPEMEEARFEAIGDVLQYDLFLPFELSLRELMGELSKVVNEQEYTSADGSPGSGRYPKGSGEKGKKAAEKGKNEKQKKSSQSQKKTV